MKIQKLLILSLLAITTFSCGSLTSGKVNKTSSQSYSASNPSDVEIFISAKPQNKYDEIGTVTVSKIKFVLIFPKNRPSEDIQNELKEKAASIGGNAIINYRESGETNITGTVVRYQ